MTTLLEARNLTRVLPGEVPVTLVSDASLKVNAGEFVAITGPSGSGKSSLLYLLALLDKPTRGQLFLQGQDTTGMDEEALARLRLEKLGFVFQFHFLLPEFTALENVMLPMQKLGKLSEAQCREHAAQILTDLGLESQIRKLPSQMSGGQRQRVALARALANDPILIFADEPTGNLDSVSSATVQKILRDFTRQKERSLIVVTHDQDFASAADRQIHIVDGRIARSG